MRIKALEDFWDIEAYRNRKKGEEFEVGEIRGNALTTANNKMGRPLCAAIDKAAKKQPKKKGVKAE